MSAADRRTAGKRVAAIERRLSRLADERSRLHDELATHATDHDAVMRLDTALRSVGEEQERLEQEWLETSTALE